MTGAAKISANLTLQNELLTIKMKKDEDLDAYSHRFDDLLTQVSVIGIINDGPEVASAYMRGMLHTEFRNLALECLSSAVALEDSSQAIERARNYQALIGTKEDTEEIQVAAAASIYNRPKRNSRTVKKQSARESTKLSEEEKFQIGRRNYLAKNEKKQQVQKKSKNIRCYRCEGYGHFAKDCKKGSGGKANESASTVEEEEEEEEDADSGSDDDGKSKKIA